MALHIPGRIFLEKQEVWKGVARAEDAQWYQSVEIKAGTQKSVSEPNNTQLRSFEGKVNCSRNIQSGNGSSKTE